VIINIARRAHDHNWELDPITRSLLDTDFYKLLMLQFIWKHFPDAMLRLRCSIAPLRCGWASWSDVEQLREQLEATRKLRFHKSELIWLAGNTFYGKRGIFEPAFLEWLDRDFRLSDLRIVGEDGQISLRFHGLWTETTMWEIYALSAIDELKTRASLKRLSEFELDILVCAGQDRLWEKMERLRGVPRLNVSDFGTRRRHSFLWHEYVVKAMSDVLGASFAGSSNTYLAYKHDLEAIGTNAHELPMALAALAESDEELRTAQYRLLELWQQTYQGELLILLPDTFGTTQFLEECAGVGGGLDRAAHGQQGPVRGGRRIHCVAGAGARSAAEAADCVGCAGCGADSGAACLLWRNGCGMERRRRISSGPATLRMNGSGFRSGGSGSARVGARS
jgi:nicotinate phosphoribosyltransferase